MHFRPAFNIPKVTNEPFILRILRRSPSKNQQERANIQVCQEIAIYEFPTFRPLKEILGTKTISCKSFYWMGIKS